MSEFNKAASYETEIYHLMMAARIAVQQLNAAVGDLECSDGKIIQVPDTDAVALATFAVGQVAAMVQKLDEKYEGPYLAAA